MKKQIKNLKQFRKFKTRAKFQFYVVFRPVAQKWFFVPFLILVIFLGIKDWYVNRGEWSFENPTVTTAAALTVRSEVIETSSESNSYTDPAVVQGDLEKLVRAICLVESNCESNRVGDGGKSFGAFQIYLPAHPNVTKEQAMDFEWAKQWTINHCKAHVSNPPMFAKCHNGIAKTTNQWYVDRVMDKYGKL